MAKIFLKGLFIGTLISFGVKCIFNDRMFLFYLIAFLFGFFRNLLKDKYQVEDRILNSVGIACGCLTGIFFYNNLI